MQGTQVLQDSGDFEERSSAHAFGVFPKAIFPVPVACRVANCKKINNLLDFPIADDTPKAHAAHAVAGHHHLQTAGLDMEEVELLHRGADGTAADLFDNTYAMIGIDDFVANVEIQVTISHMDIQDGDGAGESLIYYVYVTP